MANDVAASAGRGHEDQDEGGRTRSRLLPVYLSMEWRLKCAFARAGIRPKFRAYRPV